MIGKMLLLWRDHMVVEAGGDPGRAFAAEGASLGIEKLA